MSANRPRSSYEPDYSREPELIPASPLSASQSPASADDINQNLQQVQEQLLSLKRQQDEIERQKRELEELSRKQREFDEGRHDILEKLTRGLVLLERQEFESKRELEQIRLVRENFSEQLGQIEQINVAAWENQNLASELTKALAYIDQAKAVHNQARARLSALRSFDEGEEVLPEEYAEKASQDKTFLDRVSEGFAYSLVPLLAGLIYLVSYLIFHRPPA